MKRTKLLVIAGCHGDSANPPCPHRLIRSTPGAGCADDYHCKASQDKMIDGYVEWKSEMRKSGDFPDFCPLQDVQ